VSTYNFSCMYYMSSRTRSSTRAATSNNTRKPLNIVAQHVLIGTPVSRHLPRNAMTVTSIRRLILAHPGLYRQYGPMFRANNPPPRVLNLHWKTNVGRRFQTILRNARIVTRHRDRSVSFRIPASPQYGVPAGVYRLHPNGYILGPNGFAARFTGGNRGFMLANIN
jgi:hypothetical protein